MTVSGAPDLSLDSLQDPRVRHDPYPFYRRLREEAPVLWDTWSNNWVLTRHRDVITALRDPALAADRFRPGPNATPDQLQRVELLSRLMLFLDPPDHTRLRRLVTRTFTPRMIDRLRPAVTSLVDGLLDQARDQGGMDMVADLALPLPVNVIAEMLGIPPRDRGLLREWSVSFGRLLNSDVTLEETQSSMADLVEFVAYLTELVELRRRAPREDLISELAAVEEGGDRLTRDELLANLVLLLAAGHLTTTHLLANGTLALMRNRDQWDLLCADPSVAPSAVQELLRYDSPVQLTDRLAIRDTEIGGQQIREGQLVLVMLGAANRDPESFPDPDRLDLRRSGAQHLAFGHGIHACLGMALARMEGEIAFTRLAARLPGLRLADDNEIHEREDGTTFRGLARLDVRWD